MPRGPLQRLSLSSLLAGLLLVAAAHRPAHAELKQVLLLQSLNRGSLILDNFTGSFRVSLDQRAGKPVNLVQVVVGPTGSVSAGEEAAVEYIRSMYAGRSPPDLIVTAGGPAAVFARKYRPRLFPGTPLLLSSVDQRYLGAAPLADDETAVAAMSDFPRVVDDILQVRPRTRHVFMVIGSGTIGQFWRRQLEPAFKRFEGRVNFTWSDDLSFSAILQRVSELPPDSAIFFLLFSADARGSAYADEQVLAAIHDTANAPLFGAHSSQMGYGIVGGSLIPMDTIAEQSGEVAARLLNGERPTALRVPPHAPGPPTFDGRELRRWHIPKARLPAGSVVKFRPPNLLEEYWFAIAAAGAALLLQTLLIAWLVYERRARHRAETESRRNFGLAADANRRETMSALSASIGHELAQPLGAMLLNVEALRMKLRGRRLTDQELEEVLGDVQADATLAAQISDRHRTMLKGRQPDKAPIDLQSVVDQSLALVASDMRARRIEVALERSAESCVIEGDRVLLQQVFLNLLRNATDALAATPPAKRRIAVRSIPRTGEVAVSISDAGSGLTPDQQDDLFEPFVTTKANGLGVGLTIARSIVLAHGGTITARGNPEGGATFTITLPRLGMELARGAMHTEGLVE